MMEAQMQGDFGKWWKSGRGSLMMEEMGISESQSVACELKVARKGRFSFAQVEAHQWEGLKRSQSDVGLYMKLTDLSVGAKPFDCFVLRYGVGFVVVGFLSTAGEYLGTWFVRVEDLLKVKDEKARLGGRAWASVSWKDVCCLGVGKVLHGRLKAC